MRAREWTEGQSIRTVRDIPETIEPQVSAFLGEKTIDA